mmetsp:Transcript_24763/g.72526  ORF Transcript_24763/g.72526 Transcript_24763/m.72526 type:complete len:268 (+) Transcript_24763:307-1110(+)
MLRGHLHPSCRRPSPPLLPLPLLLQLSYPLSHGPLLVVHGNIVGRGPALVQGGVAPCVHPLLSVPVPPVPAGRRTASSPPPRRRQALPLVVIQSRVPSPQIVQYSPRVLHRRGIPVRQPIPQERILLEVPVQHLEQVGPYDVEGSPGLPQASRERRIENGEVQVFVCKSHLPIKDFTGGHGGIVPRPRGEQSRILQEGLGAHGRAGARRVEASGHVGGVFDPPVRHDGVGRVAAVRPGGLGGEADGGPVASPHPRLVLLQRPSVDGN